MSPAERLRQGLESLGLEVPAEAHPRLLWYLKEMRRWSARINLTAIKDPDEGIEKHLLDSLAPLPLLGEGERLLDLGSGAGMPSIPLKIARPSLSVASVESVGKKATFQRHVVRTLGLAGFDVRQERAEHLCRPEGVAGSFSVAISRAFSSLGDFATLALPALLPSGRLIAMKGPEGERELEKARPFLVELGLSVGELKYLRLPFSGAVRTLIVLERA